MVAVTGPLDALHIKVWLSPSFGNILLHIRATLFRLTGLKLAHKSIQLAIWSTFVDIAGSPSVPYTQARVEVMHDLM